MATETDNEVMRIANLETIVKELRARLKALEDRMAAAEQGLASKWFQ